MHIRAQINHARRHATFSAAALRKAGYHQIGRGAFSMAFVHPDAPDVVVKVGKHWNRRVGYYDGFPYFAQQLLDGVFASKFFPKIYGLSLDPSRTRFWCIMRRYNKPSRKERLVSKDIAATYVKATGAKHYEGTPKGRFRKAVEQLVDFRLKSDLHAGNVLRDAKRNPIIIDPLLIVPRYERVFYA